MTFRVRKNNSLTLKDASLRCFPQVIFIKSQYSFNIIFIVIQIPIYLKGKLLAVLMVTNAKKLALPRCQQTKGNEKRN